MASGSLREEIGALGQTPVPTVPRWWALAARNLCTTNYAYSYILVHAYSTESGDGILEAISMDCKGSCRVWYTRQRRGALPPASSMRELSSMHKKRPNNRQAGLVWGHVSTLGAVTAGECRPQLVLCLVGLELLGCDGLCQQSFTRRACVEGRKMKSSAAYLLGRIRSADVAVGASSSCVEWRVGSTRTSRLCTDYGCTI